MSCEASRGTVKYVDRCPRNESEWFESAKKKNCSGITQNCSKTDFVYHCLINSWENATVEVCALRKNIIGNLFHKIATQSSNRLFTRSSKRFQCSKYHCHQNYMYVFQMINHISKYVHV